MDELESVTKLQLMHSGQAESQEVWLLNGHTQMPWEVHESDEESFVN